MIKPINWLSVIAVVASLLLFARGGLADEQQAAEYAIDIGNKALAIIADDVEFAAKKAKLAELFVDHVDTNWIGKFVLGRNWRQMSDQQKRDYLRYYRDFLIEQYTSNFQEYAEGTNFKVTKTRPIGSKKNQYVVSMEIERAGQQPVYVDYRIISKNGRFRVIDIVVEGVSLLATQRSEFGAVVQRKGVDYLIARLKAVVEKNKQNAANG